VSNVPLSHLCARVTPSPQPVDIPCPTRTIELSDEAYTRLYPRKLSDWDGDKRIRTKGSRNRVEQRYCMDERDCEWLAVHNKSNPQSTMRAESQPAASSSSSTTAVEDDDAMDIDNDDASPRRVKTEPPPNTDSIPLGPIAVPQQRRATLDGVSAPDLPPVAGPSRLPSVAASATSTSVTAIVEHTDESCGFVTEDQFEWVMEYLETLALLEMRTKSPVRQLSTSAPLHRLTFDPQSAPKLKECVERGFPQRQCEVSTSWKSWAPKDASPSEGLPAPDWEQPRLKCICNYLSLVYPHWITRREERQGRTIMPVLHIPEVVALCLDPATQSHRLDQEVKDDHEDPYLVFRSTLLEWKAPTAQPQRSRNPRRDAERIRKLQEEAELMKHLPKRIKLLVKEPPPPPAREPTAIPQASSPAPSISSATSKANTPTASTPAQTATATVSSTPTAAASPADVSSTPAPETPASTAPSEPTVVLPVFPSQAVMPPPAAPPTVKKAANRQRGRPPTKKLPNGQQITPLPPGHFLPISQLPPGMLLPPGIPPPPPGFMYPHLIAGHHPLPGHYPLVSHQSSASGHPLAVSTYAMLPGQTPQLAAASTAEPTAYGIASQPLRASTPSGYRHPRLKDGQQMSVFKVHADGKPPGPAQMLPRPRTAAVTGTPNTTPNATPNATQATVQTTTPVAAAAAATAAAAPTPTPYMSHPAPLPYPPPVVQASQLPGPLNMPQMIPVTQMAADAQRTPVGTPPPPKTGVVTVLGSVVKDHPRSPTSNEQQAVMEARKSQSPVDRLSSTPETPDKDVLEEPLSPLTEPEPSTEPEEDEMSMDDAAQTPTPNRPTLPSSEYGTDDEVVAPPPKRRKIAPKERISEPATRARMSGGWTSVDTRDPDA